MIVPVDISKRYLYNDGYYNSGWHNYRWALLALLIFPLLAVIFFFVRRRRTAHAVYPVYDNTNNQYYQNNPNNQYKPETGYYPQGSTYVPPAGPQYPPNSDLPAYDGNENANYNSNNTNYNYGPSNGYAEGSSAGNYDNYAPPPGPPPTHSKQ